ncbi:MAG: AraC family transcriptional regulator, transcriptional activator of pobA [Gammaproteobacteria bacterium]|nr:putative transcriptional regulator, AraC/XylS family [Gammaproteobacteria bacterium]MEA3142560.1 AraC family transcriptional regulator, transcriptional activator of pobA [Gammaproteobacteria bacterium]
MPSPRRKIPSFSLYGEHCAAFAQNNSLHIESIQSRSCKYLWNIETHRHTQLSQLVLVTTGPATVHLDDRRYDFKGPAAMIIPTGTIHSFHFSAETKGHVLTVDLERLLNTAGPAHQVPIQSLFSSSRAIDLSAEEALSQRAEQLMQLLEREFKQPDGLFRPVCGWLACCTLSVLSHATLERAVESLGGTGVQHLRRFRVLIETQYSQHWPVQRFAQELGISETSLNRLCRRLAGTTAFDMIQRRVALEARRKLVYSTNSVSGIAEELGFKDVAYFCRFFRRHSGASPNHFRRHHGVG